MTFFRVIFIFFFNQKTAYEMRISDWSSDVCSSDLRVLGGGLVQGSVVLIGGDPGIGKSTLLLQMLGTLGAHLPSVYVTGEESLSQVASRAQRLGLPLEDRKSVV